MQLGLVGLGRMGAFMTKTLHLPRSSNLGMYLSQPSLISPLSSRFQYIRFASHRASFTKSEPDPPNKQILPSGRPVCPQC